MRGNRQMAFGLGVQSSSDAAWFDEFFGFLGAASSYYNAHVIAELIRHLIETANI